MSRSGCIRQGVIDFVFLRKVQSQDCVKAVKNPLYFNDGCRVVALRRQIALYPTEKASEMLDFPVRPAHRGHRVVTSDQPCYNGIHLGVIPPFVGDQLLSQHFIEIRQLAGNFNCRDHSQAVRRGTHPLQYGAELVVLGFKGVQLRCREGRPSLSGPVNMKGSQGVQYDRHIDRFLENGPAKGGR